MREKYESLSLVVLKDLAKARGLKGISTMKKGELIDRMLQEDEREKEAAPKAKTVYTARTASGAIHRRSLQPGDRVLLERGSVFYGQYLHVTDSGTKEAPIVIGAYGTADAPPRIDACGQGIWYQDYGTPLDSPTHVYHGYVSSAVLLYDAEHIVVEDLEITNEGSMIPGERYSLGEKMNRTGVAVVAKDKGVRDGITLRNLWIHDVHGNVYDKHMNNGGIYMTALRPECEERTGVARYRDIVIEGCFVHRVSRWGIAAGYTYAHDKFRGAELKEAVFLNYGHENMQIRNNYVKEAGGDGITPALFYIIIPYLHIFMPIVQKNGFLKLCSPELIMGIGVACCNSPAADPVYEASFNNDIPIPRHTRPLLTFRTERCHIDPTVVHVLIVDIPMDIMDPQIPKCDAVPHPFVLSHHSHTGTVHFLTQAIALSRDHAAFIRDLQILDHNMLCIVQKHCRRYIAVIHIVGKSQRSLP